MESKHILLVEDNEGDIVLTTEALEATSLTFTLTIRRDGKAAIEYLKDCVTNDSADSVDIILLDVNLPKKNGHEVLEYVKSNRQMQHIPVIMLTTSSAENDIQRAKKFDVNGYIIKPAEAENLFELIDAASGK